MLFSQSCGGAPALNGKKPRPVVTDSSTTIAPSGIVAPSAWPQAVERELAGRPLRPVRLGDARRRLVHGAELHRQRLERGERIAVDRAERRDLAAVRHQHARLVRIGEERDRRLGADQHHLLACPSAAPAPSRPRSAGAAPARGRRRARCARCRPRAWTLQPVLAAILPGQLEAARAQRSAADEQHRARRFCSALAAATTASSAGFCGCGVSRRLGRRHRPRSRPCRPAGSGWRSGPAPRARPGWRARRRSATVFDVGEVLTQCENGRAMPSMSAVSGASYLM